MKGKSYTAGTPEAAEAVFENCYFIDSKGRANPGTEYRVRNLITTPGKESFVLYNPETGKTRHAKRIFIPSNIAEPRAILYSHPHRGLVIVDGIEETFGPNEATVRVYHDGFLYLVSLSDLYSDSSERHPAKLDTTPAPEETPTDADTQEATTSPATISDKETTTATDTEPENGKQDATPERLKESPEPVTESGSKTTLPPTPERTTTSPETVTESTKGQQEEPAAAHATRPREGPTRPVKTASHTDTHGAIKSPYKAKYKASRTREGPPKQSLFSKVS